MGRQVASSCSSTSSGATFCDSSIPTAALGSLAKTAFSWQYSQMSGLSAITRANAHFLKLDGARQAWPKDKSSRVSLGGNEVILPSDWPPRRGPNRLARARYRSGQQFDRCAGSREGVEQEVAPKLIERHSNARIPGGPYQKPITGAGA